MQSWYFNLTWSVVGRFQSWTWTRADQFTPRATAVYIVRIWKLHIETDDIVKMLTCLIIVRTAFMQRDITVYQFAVGRLWLFLPWHSGCSKTGRGKSIWCSRFVVWILGFEEVDNGSCLLRLSFALAVRSYWVAHYTVIFIFIFFLVNKNGNLIQHHLNKNK